MHPHYIIVTCSLTGDTAGVKVSRMNYQNFEDGITDKFGVVLENWPLKTFCSPSDIKSRNEVKVLFHAWDSGATRFRKMPVAEWKEWQEKQFQQALGCSETVEDDGDGDGDGNDDGDGDGDGDQRPPGNHNGMTAGVDQRSEPGTTAFWPIDPTLQMTTDPAPTNVTTASTLAIATTSSASDGERHGGHKGKKRRREPLTDFINSTVTSSTGAPVILSKKPRKERSDKGVKRGPRARKS
jgi:hypothetical protein